MSHIPLAAISAILLCSCLTAKADPVANPDAYTVNEDATLSVSVGNQSLVATHFDNVLAGNWDYLDTISNHLTASPLTYPVDGTAQSWKANGFVLATSSVAGWKSAPMPIQTGGLNGLGVQPDLLLGTTGGSGGQNSVTTYLFRKGFTLTAAQAAAANWTARYLVDDACAIYVNGTRVAGPDDINLNPANFANAPGEGVGLLTSNTAVSVVGNENTYADLPLDLSGLLVAGTNVIAIELHQAILPGGQVSPDVGIDFSLHSGPDAVGGFQAVEDPFFGTARPDKETETVSETEGYLNTTGLKVDIGSIGVGETPKATSAGWQRQFTMAAAGDVDVSFRYRMVFGNNYEAAEFGEVLARVDGTFYGNVAATSPSPHQAVARLVGNGNGGAAGDTGWQVATFTVNLAAGIHTLTLGAYNNQSTENNAAEKMQAYFDDFSVSTQASASLLTNDTDATSVVLESGPAHGALTLHPNGSFTYAPALNYHGPDSFSYRASDGVSQSAPALVSLTINPVNDAPVAAAETYSILEGGLLTVAQAQGVLANDTDVDAGATLTALATALPGKGTLSLDSNGGFSYQSDSGSLGSDAFSYKANDGTADSNVVVVTITLLPVNDPPVGGADYYSTPRNVPLLVTTLDGSIITEYPITGTERDGAGAVSLAGSIWKYLDNGTAPAATWTTLGFNDAGWKQGASELGYGDVPEGRPEVTVVEDNPTAGYNAPDTNRYITTYFRKIFPLAGKQNITALSLEVIRDDGAQILLNTTPAMLSNLPANPTSTTPASASTPTEANWRSASDAAENALLTGNPGLVSPALLVEGDNIIAAEVHQNVATSSDMSFDLRMSVTRRVNASLLKNDSDLDLDALSVLLVSGPAHGSLSLQPDGTFTYTPQTGYTGRDSFTYRVSDSLLQSAPVTAIIDVVLGPNQPPVVNPDSYAATEDTPLVVDAAEGVLNNDSDPEMEILTASVLTGPTKGVLSLNPDGAFTYTPNNNANGPDSFNYRARDEAGLYSTAVAVTINIAPVNDPPAGAGDTFSGDVGAMAIAAAQGVLANDSDIDSSSLTAVVESPPASGTFNLQSDGGFTFNSPVGGMFTFTYRVSDGASLSGVTTATINLNSRPVVGNDAYVTGEDVALSVPSSGVLGNDSDPENASLSAVLLTNPARGSVVLQANGSFLYTPNPNANGADAFTYKAFDGTRESFPATVNIDITPANDAPVAGGDVFNILPNSAFSMEGSGILANDTDVDGDALTTEMMSEPAHGAFYLASDGSFSYSPEENFVGVDGFSYRLSDGSEFSAVVNVQFYVTDPGAVQISEIMFFAPGGDSGEEYLELHNRSASPVLIAGWQVTSGVSYIFPAGTIIGPDGYLAVPSDRAKFSSNYPGVSTVTATGWGSGSQLANGGEKITLVNELMGLIDELEYCDEGDWALRQAETVGANTGWKWTCPADGLGSSLQLKNVYLANVQGQNWASAAPTPGAPNVAIAATNSAPLIAAVQHWPPVPLGTDQVYVTARLTDELVTGISGSVHWRISSAAPVAFTLAAMYDDGAHRDALAGDGVFGGIIPAAGNPASGSAGEIIEFYVAATDGTHSRTWPSPALNQAGTSFLTQENSTNCLYQVDHESSPTSQYFYRAIMSAADGAAFVATTYPRAESNDTDENVTMIFKSGTGYDIRYLGGIRHRGAGSRGSGYRPHNWKLNLPHCDPWNGWSSMNLNSLSAHGLVLGSRMAQCAGLPVEVGTPVQVRLNGQNRLSAAFSPSSIAVYGSYSHQTPMNAEWAASMFPEDPDGNIYKKGRGAALGWVLREIPPGQPDVAGYQADAWVKQSNTAESNWSDLHGFIKTMRNATTASPLSINITQAETVMNLDQWARWWAFCVLINHRETNLSTGVDDDYSIYFGVNDPRAMVMPHDFDTILGSIGDTSSVYDATIWQAYETSFLSEKSFASAGLDIPRALFLNNKFVRKFKWHVRDLLASVFHPSNIDPMIDNVLGADGWVPVAKRDQLKTFISNRREWILGLRAGSNALTQNLLPTAFTAVCGLPVVSGYFRTTDPNGTGLTGAMDGARTARVTVNGVDAVLNNHDDIWTAAAVPAGLKPGVNFVRVDALDEAGAVFESTSLTIWYDDGSMANAATAGLNWTAAGGPYQLSASLTIPVGATLTIHPGAVVFFNPNTKLTINGRIVAEGTANARIQFSLTPGQSGNWAGLDILNSVQDNRIAYADFSNMDSTTVGGHNAKIHVNDSVASFDNCTFTNLPAKQYASFDNSSFVVSNCVFPSYEGTFNVSSLPEMLHGSTGIMAGGQAVFRNNYFGHTWGFNDTIDFTGGNRPGPILQILDNVFLGATDDCLDLDSTDAWIEGNIFMHVHQDSTRADPLDTASAISGGQDTADASEWSIVNNIFFDVDHAILAKNNCRCYAANNTIARVNQAYGNGVDIAAINFTDAGQALSALGVGQGAILENNIIFDAPALAANANPANVTVEFSSNLLPLAWSGPGSGNTVASPMFSGVLPTPSVADLNVSAGLTPAQFLANAKSRAAAIRAAVQIQPCSPARQSGLHARDLGALAAYGIGISGEPVSPTNQSTATLAIGPGAGFPVGPAWAFGYTHYKFSLDGAAYSAEIPVATPLVLSGLGNGTHSVAVVGKNDAGIWQSIPTVSRSWSVKTTAPPVIISEVLADNTSAFTLGTSHPDVIELWNYSNAAYNLGGYKISDDVANPAKFTIPPGTTIPAQGYLLLYADSLTGNGGIHTNFGLDAGGESVALFAPGSGPGAIPLDVVHFGPQVRNFSIARAGRAMEWGLATPTIGSANTLVCDFAPASELKLNEWLTARDWVIGEDFIELYNPSSKPVMMAGLRLTDDFRDYPARHVISPLSFIAASGFVRFIADGDQNAGGDHLSFKLSSFHERLGLLDESGRLLDHVVVAPGVPDLSVGRTPDGAATQLVNMTPTPGASNVSIPGTAQDILDYLRITEMHYHPAFAAQTEFIELKNTGSTPLNLEGVGFVKGITLTFSGITLAPGSYLVITNDLTKFQTQYPSVPALQWTDGSLSNGGENVRLELGDPQLGILDFDYLATWYPQTAGGGASMEIIDPNHPDAGSWQIRESWQASPPSPGMASGYGVVAAADAAVVLPGALVLDATLYAGAFTVGEISLQWSRISGPGAVFFTAPNAIDTDATVTDPGVHTFRMTATAPGNIVTSDEVTLTVLDSYASWADRHLSGQSPQDQAKTADPDFDGLSNLMEFTMSADPLLNGGAGLPVFSTLNNRLTLTYRRSKYVAATIQLLPEISDNMESWLSAPAAVTNVRLSEDGLYETWRAQDANPIGFSSRKYLRLKALCP